VKAIKKKSNLKLKRKLTFRNREKQLLLLLLILRKTGSLYLAVITLYRQSTANGSQRH